MLFGILLFIFIIVCFLLCAIVLIQSDKGGGLSGAIGGFGGASNFLGTQDTANILTRGTAIFATAFMVLCVIISFVVSNTGVTGDRSLLQERAQQEQSSSPSSALKSEGLPFADEQNQQEVPVVPDKAEEQQQIPVVPDKAEDQQQNPAVPDETDEVPVEPGQSEEQ